MRVIVTGGAGFIGSELVRQLIRETDYEVVNIDKLTYAGNLESVLEVSSDPRYRFIQQDICDTKGVRLIFDDCWPDAVVHLAAESHVDRSIDGSDAFVRTNVVGTHVLLDVCRSYWDGLSPDKKESFRFLHVSTDEVYGSLGLTGLFDEESAYRPNSPYSASKAASDHLVRAWNRTYRLPTIITNCSNNYGHYQFPEKLIPITIRRALMGKPISVYGKGENVRDWIHVSDHVRGLRVVLAHGRPGESYNIGGGNERSNLEVVHDICDAIDEVCFDSPHRPHKKLIKFVADRPGHDFRYAIDTKKIERELGWRPKSTFRDGLYSTVKWYLENRNWVERVMSGAYRGERLGLAGSLS